MTEGQEVPEHRCGFELTPEDPRVDWDGDLTVWRGEIEAISCCREPWRDFERCIWHAEVEDKPVSELKSIRADELERIDGAYLAGVDADEGFSFQGCKLEFADFTDAHFVESAFDGTVLSHANFRNAVLSGAQFSHAHLRDAEFPDADLSDADFRETDLSGAKFPEANLYKVYFFDADLHFAQFIDAFLHFAQFHDVSLWQAQFHDSDLPGAQFHDANLRDAKFPNADFSGAQFHDAHLRGAKFPATDLSQAEFEDVDAQYAYFGAANLQETTLVRTDLRGATLINAHFDQTVFSDLRIDATTDFGDSPDKWGPTCVYETHPEATEPPSDRSRWEAAEWVYRRLQRLHEENALSEEARGFHVRKEEVRRKYQKQKLTESREQFSDDLADNNADAAYESLVEMLRRDTRYSVSTLNWHLTRHGESLRQIFVSAGVLIFACGLLYPFVGGFESSANDTAYRIPLTEAYQVLSLDGVTTLLQGIYFSIITFTTIGYGDLYPTGVGSKVLVGFESLAGAILIALFVFVLGRQVAR